MLKKIVKVSNYKFEENVCWDHLSDFSVSGSGYLTNLATPSQTKKSSKSGGGGDVLGSAELHFRGEVSL